MQYCNSDSLQWINQISRFYLALSVFLYRRLIKSPWQRVFVVCVWACFQTMDHYWKTKKHMGNTHLHFHCCSKDLKLWAAALILLFKYSQVVYWRVLWTTRQVNWVQGQVLPFACFVAMETGIKLPECEVPKWTKSCLNLGFPGGASGKESACQCRRYKRQRFYPWVRKIPWSRKWHPTPVFLPGKFHQQRSLAGYSPWGHK